MRLKEREAKPSATTPEQDADELDTFCPATTRSGEECPRPSQHERDDRLCHVHGKLADETKELERQKEIAEKHPTTWSRPQLRPARRLRRDDIEALIERSRRGDSPEQLAEAFGIHPSTVERLLSFSES